MKKWNPKRLPENFSALVVSPRRYGKTTFVRDVLHRLKGSKLKRYEYDLVLLFSETCRANPQFPEIPTGFQYDYMNDDLLAQLMDSQQRKKEKGLKMAKVLVIIDDCAGTMRGSVKSKNLNRLFLNGRHFGISLIVLTQSYKSLSRPAQMNCDVIVTWRLQNELERQTICRNHLSTFGELGQACKIGYEFYNKVFDKDYKALIIENHRVMNCSCLEDYCFWYIARKSVPKYKLMGDSYYDDEKIISSIK